MLTGSSQDTGVRAEKKNKLRCSFASSFGVRTTPKPPAASLPLLLTLSTPNLPEPPRFSAAACSAFPRRYSACAVTVCAGCNHDDDFQRLVIMSSKEPQANRTRFRPKKQSQHRQESALRGELDLHVDPSELLHCCSTRFRYISITVHDSPVSVHDACVSQSYKVKKIRNQWIRRSFVACAVDAH